MRLCWFLFHRLIFSVRFHPSFSFTFLISPRLRMRLVDHPWDIPISRPLAVVNTSPHPTLPLPPSWIWLARLCHIRFGLSDTGLPGWRLIWPGLGSRPHYLNLLIWHAIPVYSNNLGVSHILQIKHMENFFLFCNWRDCCLRFFGALWTVSGVNIFLPRF